MGSECCSLYLSPSVSQPPQVVERMPTSKTPLLLDPVLDHIQSTPQLLNSPPPPSPSGMPLSAPLPQEAAGICTQNHRAGCMQQQKACSSAWARPHPLPSRSWDRAGSHPSTQNKMTHERKQIKTGEPPGLEEGRGSPKGNGASSYERIRPWKM